MNEGAKAPLFFRCVCMIVKCPLCGKEVEWKGNPFRPFCSERCKNIDLAAWASGEYRVAGNSSQNEEEDDETAGE